LKEASAFNRSNFISGHMSAATTLHVAGVLEGKEKLVLAGMKRTRKDPRIVIKKEFVKKQLSMHLGWGISMHYSFEITSSQLRLVQDDDLTMEELFDMMKNSDQVIRERLNIQSFYKEITDTILLKFISLTEKEKLKPS